MNNKIKVGYYDTFRCTADQCPYTCCQEWFITIDDETRTKWQGVALEEKVLSDCIQKDDDGYSMMLNTDKKCHFLTCNGLCGMVVNLGEEYLSKICMSYPRHISQYSDRQEYALDFGCPAVIDLLNENEKEITFVAEGFVANETDLAYQIRELVVNLVKDTTYPLKKRLMATYYCLLDLLEQEALTLELINSYKEKTYIEELIGEIDKVEVDEIDSFWEKNEFFLDSVQLYQEEEIYTGYLEEIAHLAKNLERDYSDTQLQKKLNTFSAQYQQYNTLMNNYLVAELWANILKSDITVEDMVSVFCWITLEYCTIQHTVFLKWITQGESELNYESVRDYMMIVSRMSSDDFKEIETYMELSFGETFLEWGHLALIVG